MNIYRWTCPAGHYEVVATDIMGAPSHVGHCLHMDALGDYCRRPLVLTVEYGEEARCGFEWSLDDPNEEDSAAGRSHRCRLLTTDHTLRHVCGCGAFIDGSGRRGP